MRLRDPLSDGQTQPCPSTGAVQRRGAAIHRHKDVWQILWRNARAAVGEAEAEASCPYTPRLTPDSIPPTPIVPGIQQYMLDKLSILVYANAAFKRVQI